MDVDQEVLYGASIGEWLGRWDSGDSVWSIEMGGMGPGYEQAIQVTATEFVRHLVEVDYDAAEWQNDGAWERDLEAIEAWFKTTTISADLGGLSGAQYGAALQLATKLYLYGPVGVMNDEAVKDRHIQVQREFPQL